MPAFSIAIFLSAFLLFIVQPLLAKKLLLWFGGSPSVWLTNVLFFQITLLLGYLYAFFLTKLTSLRKQGVIHFILLAGSFVFVPITLQEAPPTLAWQPFAILSVLSSTLFVPALLLSSTSPLLQFWFLQCKHTEFPYRYYALSNFGSLLGLFAYPFALEPWIGLKNQNIYWSILYGIFGLSLLGCLYHIWQRPFIHQEYTHKSPISLSPLHVGAWLLLTFMSCGLLLTTSQVMMQSVAGFPLLWVLPLALYLITFILTFYQSNWYHRGFWVSVFFLFSAGIFAINSHHQLFLSIQIVVFSIFLFAGCMICHGELVRLKPAPTYLTAYYLAIALGGVLGGIFINLIAPLIFDTHADFYLLTLGIFIYLSIPAWKKAHLARKYWRPVFLFTLPLIGLCSIILYRQQEAHHRALYLHRNFFGTFEVVERNSVFNEFTQRQLRHGHILHGAQYMQLPERRQAFTYYGPHSGVQMAINYERKKKSLEPHRPGLRIGIIGLGAGTLAALGQHGDFLRFYEIDPAIVTTAQKFFYYLQDSQAALDIVIGDGRLVLQQELQQKGPQHYDVLVIDAFNGDAIPVHLLTREAIELYLSHLTENGVIAFHTSSRYVNLYPPLQALAASLGLYSYLTHNSQDIAKWISSAEWVLLSRQSDLGAYLFAKNALIFRPERTKMIWTDDYHTLLPLIRW